ncbi:hypothetical protein [Pseudomonas sp. VI4.1]|uniref:hypothetical protein n=1 Tax=Pseudomonas sp. VI4.1 TaxID=1941346 RepID=UPI0009C62D53|nr:hypothetical protein [Pseudomonas sp. VI4.1]OPK06787.1 hypothetical protein BZ163_29735 [Pseudomonas sp. VI4.1]
MTDINAHSLLNEAREAREKLALLGGHDRLLAKIDSMLALHHHHGGQLLTLKNWLDQAERILK